MSPGGRGPYGPEEELALLEHVARTIGDFVLVTDTEGRLTYVNEAVLERSGWTREELLGKSWRIFLGDANPPGLVERISAATRAGGFQGDILNVTKSGEEFWVALRTSTLRRDGADAGFVSISRDIGERKRSEARLKEARDAAEAASRAKTEFLANISHEIRTPMNAVIGMAGLLLETALTPEQRDYVETIRTSGDTLLTLLNDVLDFSKMESERLELESRPFSLREAVEDSFDLVAPAAAGKGLDLAYRVDPSVPPALLGDVTRVRQVLLNLLSNAVKFTQSGEVVLRASAAEEGGRQRVAIVVRDTGIGIPQARLDRLFQSFSQVDPSTTRQFGGTGLGLAICKRLAEKMGGGIEASSGPSGSTFRVTLLVPEGPPRREAAVPGLERLAGQRVLLVDDGAGSRETLAETLAGWGMLPRTTASAREALGWLEAGEAFDLGLVDEEMAELDGRRFAESARRLRDADSLPLVLLTSRGRRAGGSRGPFSAVAARPLRPRSLASVLAGIRDDSVSRRRRRSSSTALPRDLGTTHPLRLLLAEDNPVNQKVALSLLSRMGYRADLATTGREALEAARRGAYDVVLMDVQMPEMDGLEATKRIRALLPSEDGPWIVALTAGAMTGDAERCTVAGMNDYLAKPVRIEELAAALRRAPRRARAGGPAERATAGLPVLTEGPLETLRALEGRDGGFLVSLLAIFRRDTPLRIEEMERSAAAGDAATFRRAAHSLKSSAASLGGGRVEALAARMESLSALPATLPEAAELLPALRAECAALFAALGLEGGEEGARLSLDTGEYGRS